MDSVTDVSTQIKETERTPVVQTWNLRLTVRLNEKANEGKKG